MELHFGVRYVAQSHTSISCQGVNWTKESTVLVWSKHRNLQASLSASRNDLISTRPPPFWTSANSWLEALCTILPLPSTLHLCSLQPAASTFSNQRPFPSDTSTLPVALFSRQLSQVRLQSWFSKPLQSSACTEFKPDASSMRLLPWWTKVLYTIPNSSSIKSSRWFSPLSRLSPVPKRLRTLDCVTGSRSSC